RVLEALLPVMRAARLRLPTSAQLRRNWALYVDVGDREVRTVFATELGALPREQADGVLHALYLVSSSGAWDALRGDRRLGPEAAQSVMESSVRSLLAALTTRTTPCSEGPR
ncbi:MAG: TetR/AcrR family transcriptional regulator, partial [Frankiales bacterium]|nr:TetR/AcrR family transcriptional regulator [Frankiales bacterium]